MVLFVLIICDILFYENGASPIKLFENSKITLVKCNFKQTPVVIMLVAELSIITKSFIELVYQAVYRTVLTTVIKCYHNRVSE